jgi:hypothetical protein
MNDRCKFLLVIYFLRQCISYGYQTPEEPFGALAERDESKSPLSSMVGALRGLEQRSKSGPA